MAEFDIRIVTRHDFVSQWENSGSIIKKGELAIGFSNTGVPVELKIGVGNTWNNTPTGLVPFNPIVVSGGRNLDTPTLRDATWNLQTLDEALQAIFAPYVIPSLSVTPNTFTTQEVGSTFTINNQQFTVSAFNTKNILTESGFKRLYVDGSSVSLTDQSSNTINQIITKTITANRNISGNETVITISVKDSKSGNLITPVIASVPFRRRSGYFLWKNNDSLFNKSDSEISSIIRGLNNITGVRNTGISGDGQRGHGTIPFNTTSIPLDDVSASGGNGFYDIYCYNPEATGNPILFNPSAGSSNSQTVERKNFSYTNGSASLPYILTKTLSGDKIVGTYSLTIQ
jgi:hypothetical protein